MIKDYSKTFSESLIIRCSCCGTIENLHMHHIIPRFLGFNDEETIPLCQKHHSIIHNILGKVIWDNRSEDNETIKTKIKQFTKWYCKDEIGKFGKHDKKYYSNRCRICLNVRPFITLVFWDYHFKYGSINICKECTQFIDKDAKIVNCKNCGKLFENGLSNFRRELHNHFSEINCICPFCLWNYVKNKGSLKRDDNRSL